MNMSSPSIDTSRNQSRDGKQRSASMSPNKNPNFKILVVSWNMMGKLPSQKTLETLLPVERTSADLIVIGRGLLIQEPRNVRPAY